jgi:hypothetical protein
MEMIENIIKISDFDVLKNRRKKKKNFKSILEGKMENLE